MKRFFLLFSIMLFFSIRAANCQDQFTDLRGSYLGQKPPGSKPVLFAPEIFKEFRAFNSVFSPDGKEFYFSVTNPKRKKDEILVTKQINGRWTRPATAHFSGIHDDCDMHISYDGSRFFFISIGRILPGKTSPTTKNHMWSMRKGASGWEKPELVDYPGNQGGIYPVITKKGTLYFSARLKAGQRYNDLYRIKFLNGSWSAPEDLGSAINSDYHEGDSFIASDESYIIVTRSRHPDNIGVNRADLYISFRKKDGKWTNLKNMESLINTGNSEYCPMVSPDSKYFFFTRISYPVRKKEIYWVDAKILEKYKPEDLN